MGVQPPRKSRLVLWISVIAVFAGVLATALLANDKRNLRYLIQRYRIDWIVLDPVATAKMPTVAKRGNRLIPTAASLPARLPSHAFQDFNTPPAGFTRRWQVSGEKLCGALADAGLEANAWHQGDLYSATYECSLQISGQEVTGAESASLFMLVRGTPTGDVSSVRIKAIIPDTEEAASIRDKFRTAVDVLFQQSKWVELSALLEPIANFENVTQSTNGARLSFAHEFTDTRRFNLILDLNPNTPEQKRTSLYFNRSKWIPLSEAWEN